MLGSLPGWTPQAPAVPPVSTPKYPQDGFGWGNKSEPDTTQRYPWDAMAEERSRCGFCDAPLPPEGPSIYWCDEAHQRQYLAKLHEERQS